MQYRGNRTGGVSFSVVNSILSKVKKPLRYIGNEYNAIHKEWDSTLVKFVISYPDLYEIGMSYYGLRILYHLLNSYPDVLCERVFAPAYDLEIEMRKQNLPLTSLESHTPLKDFDCIGFSLQHELNYTNVLNMLELGGIPIFREERKEGTPIVIGGGPCVFNPKPIEEFFDCLVIGEAEAILPQIVEKVKLWKKKEVKRGELLKELAKIEGVYIPSITERVSKKFSPSLSDEDFPLPWVVPYLEIIQDYFVVEIARGCTAGCRFCQAGMITRPYREREVDRVISLLEKGVRSTGYLDVSLLSLCIPKYSQWDYLFERLKKLSVEVNLNLPSLPIESLTEEWFSLVGRGGITLAPETGSERLRNKINKPIEDGRLIEICRKAEMLGATHLKLYYMIGLPGEKEDDLSSIISLTTKLYHSFHRKRINITLSPFTPKPHTPFQWEAQLLPGEVSSICEYLKKSLKRKNVYIKTPNPYAHFIEGICARGDSSISKVIYEAWRLGAKFDNWDEFFEIRKWERAFEKVGVEPTHYLEKREKNSPLPWEVVDSGVSREFLIKESEALTSTKDCREEGCLHCGVCNGENLPKVPQKKTNDSIIEYGRYNFARGKTFSPVRYRVKFAKSSPLKYLGHLDLVRTITRAIIRANIPVVYREGYTKRVKISFSPPLPFGLTSCEEYCEIWTKFASGDIKVLLNRVLPSGLKVLEVVQVWKDTGSLFERLKRCKYRVKGVKIAREKVEEFLQKKEVKVNNKEIRGAIIDIEVSENYVDLTMKLGKVKPITIVEYLVGEELEEVEIERIKYIL